ncbi:MAG: hypothetical protein N2037_02515 [Acidimicrobiales bacterium]|nr:hypothetical protein [Acidimicrobiales bacterium]
MTGQAVPFPLPTFAGVEQLADFIDADSEQRSEQRNDHAVAYGFVACEATRTRRGGIQLAAHELNTHPADALTGFTAPDDWIAFAVTCHGTAYHWADDDPPRGNRFSRTEPVDRVRLLHLVHRDGSSLTRMRADSSGELLEHRSQASRGQPDEDTAVPGRIDDTCRRVLGLPTAAPDTSPHELWATIWLDAVVAFAADSPTTATARSVGMLHPAFRLWTSSGHPMPQWSPDLLIRFGQALGNVTDWEFLRARCARGRFSLGEVTPDAAAWMDAGMFSRAVLGSFLTIDHYLGLLIELLSAQVFDEIRSALHAWEVPHSVSQPKPCRDLPVSAARRISS